MSPSCKIGWRVPVFRCAKRCGRPAPDETVAHGEPLGISVGAGSRATFAVILTERERGFAPCSRWFLWFFRNERRSLQLTDERPELAGLPRCVQQQATWGPRASGLGLSLVRTLTPGRLLLANPIGRPAAQSVRDGQLLRDGTYQPVDKPIFTRSGYLSSRRRCDA